MTDLWTLLLQTLTASGAAALLLVLKTLFRDKLSPRWQFGAWGVLGLVLLCPAGLGGRWALFPWARWVEAARSTFTGEYGALAQVTAPIPLFRLSPPQTIADWLFILYTAGVLFFLLRYAWSYLRLRQALTRAHPQENAAVQAAATRFGLSSCPAAEIPGLPSAFVCGIFRPVLALPAEQTPDEKVLLHELMHLHHHDILWGLVICFFRCLHWCNPLLWLCCNLAQNDLEALCDQRVLERLEGEERRDYGRILLSMADERCARFPGTSSIANGRRNIRRRMEAIVRFKRYPAGMGLVSVCILLAVAVPLLTGHSSDVPADFSAHHSTAWNLASARTVYCTTSDGAFDTYAKAVLSENSRDFRQVLAYRAICAPLSEQNALAEQWQEMQKLDLPAWKALSGVPCAFYDGGGYVLYNLTPTEDGGWQGLLALHLLDSPEQDSSTYWYAYQRLRAEREGPRWVVRPLEDFWLSKEPVSHLLWQKEEVRFTHQGESERFQIRLWTQQQSMMAEAPPSLFEPAVYSVTPEPDGQFIHQYGSGIEFRYKEPLRQESVSFSGAPWYPGTERPALCRPDPQGGTAGRDGTVTYTFSPGQEDGDHGNPVYKSGESLWFYWGTFGDHTQEAVPFALDLYLDGQLQEQLTLQPTGE